jgi:RimJ/RimL family protein N-acetyltransferase
MEKILETDKHKKLLFASERCFVRRFVESDIDDFILYRNNKSWMQYQGFTGLSKEQYKNALLIEVDVKLGAQFAIISKNSNRLIGDVYIKKQNDIYWLGYTINPDHKRQGYAYEVVLEAIKWMKRTSNNKIMAAVAKDNTPSIA